VSLFSVYKIRNLADVLLQRALIVCIQLSVMIVATNKKPTLFQAQCSSRANCQSVMPSVDTVGYQTLQLEESLTLIRLTRCQIGKEILVLDNQDFTVLSLYQHCKMSENCEGMRKWYLNCPYEWMCIFPLIYFSSAMLPLVHSAFVAETVVD
jgi:hypothetical protein